MGREVFVSYKYSDAVDTRDEIRDKLGKEGHYYNGERGYVALEKAGETIKNYLKDMIYDTSVTIVVISPQVKYSNWVDWEIRYSLRQTTRDGRTSHRNGIVCVIQNCKDFLGNENTRWAQDYNGNYRKDIFPEVIIDNMQTTFPKQKTYVDYLRDNNHSQKDYCIVISESMFKSSPTSYIEEAYRRANDSQYEVVVNKTEY